ncbi:DUF4255 domain-containing protein [Frankia sp. CNm7]|uniref:DUF4255 domain-containing protein n=1 Tax=Frankia nepalensis TaxID=1836974 RepID=UPI001934515E|nr:DUF4255 domain-containing protein [Frankia nepalensis]MBL7519820.1 DUF4255 domain-containing protein [Frankia nepalensis]
MTTSLGIAATTAVLRQLLVNAIPAADLQAALGVSAIEVSALPPDRIDVTAETSRLNLFMYQVRPNTGWSTTDLPSHDRAGRRLTNPPLALDLSYLLSAYGSKDLHGEILLGYGALVLHQTRVLTRDAIRATFAPPLPTDLALLATAGLENQEEVVSLSMESLSTDELSRLWSVFGEKYRPSIAFQARVVLLRATDPAAPPGPPVRRARLAMSVSLHPTITAVEPTPVTAVAGAAVELVGTGLLGGATTVLFGGGETATPAGGSTPSRVRVTLPGTLRAGVNTVRLRQSASFEGDLRAGPESNVLPFLLRPAFALTGTAKPDLTVSGRVVDPGDAGLLSATVTARLVPPVGRRQRVSLLLTQTDAAPGAVPRGYTIPAPARDQDQAETTDTVAFALERVARARYAAPVRVAGAAPALGATAGVYDQPEIDLR